MYFHPIQFPFLAIKQTQRRSVSPYSFEPFPVPDWLPPILPSTLCAFRRPLRPLRHLPSLTSVHAAMQFLPNGESNAPE